MVVQLSHELELKNASASELWKLYGTGFELANFVIRELPNLFGKLDVVEGDGGEGTIFQVTYPPDQPWPTSYKEKFIKVDHEKRVKEVMIIEGGFLDLGFTLYLFRLEVIAKGNESSIIRSTVEYDVKEEAAANASYATVQPLVEIAQAVKEYFLKKKEVDVAN